jgi:hypothetical protein
MSGAFLVIVSVGACSLCAENNCGYQQLLPLLSNLPFNITADEMFDIFGKYGAIRQIRV